MFWKKKEQAQSADVRPASFMSVSASPPPRPILKAVPEDNGAGSPSIRFAGQRSSSVPPAGSAQASRPPVTPVASTRSQSAGPAQAVYTPLSTPSSLSSMSRPSSTWSTPGTPLAYPPAGSTPAPAEGIRRPPPIHTQFPSSPVPSPAAGSSSSSRNPVQRTAATGSRRSSRPTSPAVTSFGSRVRVLQEAATVNGTGGPVHLYQQPLMTPPPSVALAAATSSGVCTPPTAYGPTPMIRAPPSPYRGTTSSTAAADRRPMRAVERAISMDRRENLVAARPPRASSLYDSSTSQHQPSANIFPGGQTVPMLNIIPATPQELGEGFEPVSSSQSRPVYRRPRRRSSASQQSSLAEAVVINENHARAGSESSCPAKVGASSEGRPAIEVKLEFSPFDPEIELPSISPSSSTASVALQGITEDEAILKHPQIEQAPRSADPVLGVASGAPSTAPSSSLPSLVSNNSITSSASSDSIRFEYDFDEHEQDVDVQEAIGNMLASLSESMPSLPSVHSLMTEDDVPTPTMEGHGQRSLAAGGPLPSLTKDDLVPPANPGLGLGLDLPASASITAPLVVSPRKKRPPPLDLSRAKSASSPEHHTAPPCINHRRPFYGTAKAHPRSPSSGVFYQLSTSEFESEPMFVEGVYDGASLAKSSSSSSSSSRASSSQHSLSQFSSSASLQQQYQLRDDNAGGDDAKRRGCAYSSCSTSSSSSSSLADHRTFGHRSNLSRDSISLASEASDDDPHTASIVQLQMKPVMMRPPIAGVTNEEVLGEEVGVAL